MASTLYNKNLFFFYGIDSIVYDSNILNIRFDRTSYGTLTWTDSPNSNSKCIHNIFNFHSASSVDPTPTVVLPFVTHTSMAHT
jgi:hypothetical protein